MLGFILAVNVHLQMKLAWVTRLPWLANQAVTVLVIFPKIHAISPVSSWHILGFRKKKSALMACVMLISLEAD